MRFLDWLVSNFTPYECLGCEAEGCLLCAGCISLLPEAENFGDKTKFLQSLQSATPYKGLAKDLIWKFKSEGAVTTAKIMAKLMLPLLPANDLIIVAVPTATSRVRQRGYDQAQLIARELARQSGLPSINCLARSTQAHQVGSSREQRLRQLTGAFRVTKPRLVKGARILLVDDVVTTGATMEVAASVLYRAGAVSVEGLTFAQTL